MGGGPESQTNTWNFVRKIAHFFKKIKCSPKSKTNPTLHLVESQTCAVGGWSPMFGTKSQKGCFFFTPSLIYCIKGISSIVLVWWKSNAQAASVCPCLDLAPLVVPGSGHLQPSLIKFSRFDFFKMYLVFRGQKFLQHWKPLFSTQLIEVS